MKKHRDGNRGVTDKNEPRENAAGRGKTGRDFLVIQSEGLKETRSAVAEMEGEQEHSQDVKARDENILKAVDHHRINVVAIERICLEQKETRIGHAHGEMCEVVKNKGQHDEPAHRHGTRGEG